MDLADITMCRDYFAEEQRDPTITEIKMIDTYWSDHCRHTTFGMSKELGAQVFGQPNHEVFLGRDYGNTQDYSEATARRIDDEVARLMREAHDRAYKILSSHADQMNLMANVLLERETVDGEACQALLNNTWDDYLAHEDEIIAMHEREEAEARARDAAATNLSEA